MRKKVLIFSLAYFPKPVGGAEVAIQEITDRISDLEFHLVTHRFDAQLSAEERRGNVEVHRVGSGTSYLAKIFFIPRAAFAAWRLHRQHTFDGAWAVMCYMTFPLTLLRLCGIRIPYALTLQEGDPFEHVFGRWYVRVVAPLLRHGFQKARVVHTISTFLADWARAAGRTGAVEVIPNGVDIEHFSQGFSSWTMDQTRDALRKRMGDVFLVTTSRLVHKNAVDDCIRALARLPENVHFIVIGTGPDEEMLKKRAAELRVAERVQFIGHIDHEELPKYLKACDIFIRPSRSEGMGNSFLEAFAAGLPVIATQEGGIADFLFDEKRNPEKPITGWAVDKDSPEQIVAAVEEIMSRPEKVRAVVAIAKQVALEKYDWDDIARAVRERVFARLF